MRHHGHALQPLTLSVPAARRARCSLSARAFCRRSPQPGGPNPETRDPCSALPWQECW